MWVCTGCGAQQNDTMMICPNDKVESPMFSAAKQKAVDEAKAAKAVADQQAAEALAKEQADAALKAAVAEATK